jgi:hypothetical protein
MTDGFVLMIEIESIALINTLQDLRERRFAGFDQQIDMVAHEYVGVRMIMIPVPVNEEVLEKFILVCGLFEDLLALIPPRDHVVECAFKLDTRLPWHTRKLSREEVECQF